MAFIHTVSSPFSSSSSVQPHEHRLSSRPPSPFPSSLFVRSPCDNRLLYDHHHRPRRPVSVQFRPAMTASSSSSSSPSSPPSLSDSDSDSTSFAPGVLGLEHEGAYAVMDAANALEARTGRGVVHLEIGQPGFDTPVPIADAGVDAIRRGRTRYSSPAGDSCLRGVLAKWMRDVRGAGFVQPENVVVGPGAKPGLFFTTLALVRGRDDEVIIPDPGFPTYRAMVDVAGGTCVPVRLERGDTTDDGVKDRGVMQSFDMDEFEKKVNRNTRLVILNSPGNPTGGVMPRKDIERVAELARMYDFWVLSDEIYSQLTYNDDTNYFSILDVPHMKERTVIVDGFSKSFCMTGWRLGWAIMPRSLAQKVELLLVHAVGCTATFVQDAGVEAVAGLLKGHGKKALDDMRAAFRRRRNIVVEGINRSKYMSCDAPQGAFYAWVDITKTGRGCREVAKYLLEQSFVAVLPGTDFGKNGEGFIRISYVSEEDVLVEGVRRIEAGIKALMGDGEL